jgi:hypothetical protein
MTLLPIQVSGIEATPRPVLVRRGRGQQRKGQLGVGQLGRSIGRSAERGVTVNQSLSFHFPLQVHA